MGRCDCAAWLLRWPEEQLGVEEDEDERIAEAVERVQGWENHVSTFLDSVIAIRIHQAEHEERHPAEQKCWKNIKTK